MESCRDKNKDYLNDATKAGFVCDRSELRDIVFIGGDDGYRVNEIYLILYSPRILNEEQQQALDNESILLQRLVILASDNALYSKPCNPLICDHYNRFYHEHCLATQDILLQPKMRMVVIVILDKGSVVCRFDGVFNDKLQLVGTLAPSTLENVTPNPCANKSATDQELESHLKAFREYKGALHHITCLAYLTDNLVKCDYMHNSKANMIETIHGHEVGLFGIEVAFKEYCALKCIFFDIFVPNRHLPLDTEEFDESMFEKLRNAVESQDRTAGHWIGGFVVLGNLVQHMELPVCTKEPCEQNRYSHPIKYKHSIYNIPLAPGMMLIRRHKRCKHENALNKYYISYVNNRMEIAEIDFTFEEIKKAYNGMQSWAIDSLRAQASDDLWTDYEKYVSSNVLKQSWQ